MSWPRPVPAPQRARHVAWCRGGCTAATSAGCPIPPSGCQEVLIILRARRFLCTSQACAKVTFAEQVPGLTSRYARRTGDLHKVLQAVALALGGRAGARLSAKLACPVGRSTLLRLIRAAPDPAACHAAGAGRG